MPEDLKVHLVSNDQCGKADWRPAGNKTKLTCIFAQGEPLVTTDFNELTNFKLEGGELECMTENNVCEGTVRVMELSYNDRKIYRVMKHPQLLALLVEKGSINIYSTEAFS